MNRLLHFICRIAVIFSCDRITFTNSFLGFEHTFDLHILMMLMMMMVKYIPQTFQNKNNILIEINRRRRELIIIIIISDPVLSLLCCFTQYEERNEQVTKKQTLLPYIPYILVHRNQNSEKKRECFSLDSVLHMHEC